MCHSWKSSVSHVVTNSMECLLKVSILVLPQGYTDYSRAFIPVILNISNLISSEIAPSNVWPRNSLDFFHCISLSSCELWKFALINCGACSCDLDSKKNICAFCRGYKADSSLHDKLPLRPSADKPGEKHWLLTHIPSWLLSLFLVCLVDKP